MAEEDTDKKIVACSCTSIILIFLFIWLFWPVQTYYVRDCEVSEQITESEWFKHLPS